MAWDDTWETSVAEPKVELLGTGALVNTINLDLGFPGTTFNGSIVVRQRFVPRRARWELADNTEEDQIRGFRYYAQLWYEAATCAGRDKFVAVINHLGKDLAVRFYPRRDKADISYICILDEDPAIDAYPQDVPVGYEIAFSLIGKDLLSEVPGKIPDYFTDFTAVALAYIAGDRVRDFASVAAAYNPTDKPGYFSGIPTTNISP